MRHVDVGAAKTTGSGAEEEEQAPVFRQGRCALGRVAVDRCTEVDRRFPGALHALAPGHPDVVAAESTWSVRDEVQRVLIGRKTGVRVEGARVDDRAEIHGFGPLGAGEAVGLETVYELVGLHAAGDEYGERSQRCDDTARGYHGASLPLGVRVDIQMSLPPRPPVRLEAKTSVRPSYESVG